jgi:hypothetical protein
VIPTRAFNIKSATTTNNGGGEEENAADVKRVLFALDCCGKIALFLSNNNSGTGDGSAMAKMSRRLNASLTNEVVKFCVEKLYIVEEGGRKEANRELYTASVACLSALAKKKRGGHNNEDGGCAFTIEDVGSLLKYVEKGTSVGDSRGTLACGGSLRVLAYLMPTLLEQKRRKYGLASGGGGGEGTAAASAAFASTADGEDDENNDVVANFLGQRRRTGVEEMELKMYSKTTTTIS